MRTTGVAFSIVASCIPLLAQQVAPGPMAASTEPIEQRVSIADSSGLQPARDGRGLLGGGSRYRVHLTGKGMRFEPALGSAVAQTQHLLLTPTSVRRGTTTVAELPSFVAPVQTGRTAAYQHAASVTERYEVRPDGVELSWLFEQPLAGDGDLVVRYSVDTSLSSPIEDEGGLAFLLPTVDGDQVGGVHIGAVSGIDALGNTVDGALRYEIGMMELSLPAAFVTNAAYPLVLDPMIGGVFGVMTLATTDDEPDAAYDRQSDTFLVVWNRTFSASDSAPRGQRVASSGALVGGIILFGTGGLAARPRVANVATRHRFGVAWSKVEAGTSSVQFEAVSAVTGAITNSLEVTSSPTGTFSDADIGGQVDAGFIALGSFVVLYHDHSLQAIRARRIGFNVINNLISGIPFTILADAPFGNSYTQPAISRTASSDGKFLVVARKATVLSLASVFGIVVDADTEALGPTLNVYSALGDGVSVPDVDGYASQWVVAWQQATGGSVFPSVSRRSVTLHATTATFATSAVETIVGGLFGSAALPSVGYTPGKSWLGYRWAQATISSVPSLRVTGIDSGSSASCNDTFVENVNVSDTRIVTATMTSGGLTSGEDALAVWGETGNIFAQRLRNHANSGAIVNIGGGCGAGGTQSFSHNPSIGSSGFVCSVNGLSPTAVVTVFNFSAPGAAIPCGSCVWTPFSVTLTPPITAGNASVEFPIPCLPALAGSLFETQWTTIDLSQSPCPLLPGFALSPRAFLTIGP